jgi:hypothetical protein
MVVGTGQSFAGGPVDYGMPDLRQPDAAGQTHVFYVSGSVNDVPLGGSVNLILFVQNPNGSTIQVQTIQVLDSNANAGCSGANLIVTTSGTPLNTTYTITLNPALSIAPGQSAAVPPLPIGLVATAPAACSGASFPLQYGGTGTGG